MDEPLIPKAIEAIQGDPEWTICLVVTPSEQLTNQQSAMVSAAVQSYLIGTKWEGLKVLVSQPGWTIQAVDLPKAEVEKVEAWRDKEPML